METEEIAERLDDEEREVFFLLLQDYKKVEIAGELGISLKRIDRIREKIRKVAEEVIFSVTDKERLFLWDPLKV